MFTKIKLKDFAFDKLKFDAIEKWINATVNFQVPIVLTDASTVNWNYSDSYNVQVTLTASRTLAINQIKSGAYGTIKIIQGGSGSYTLTLPTGSKVANAGAGAITLSTAVGAIDIASFYYDGTNYFWTLSTDFT